MMPKTASLMCAAFVMAGLCAAPPASAQISKLPPEVAARIAEMGPKLDMPLINTTIGLIAPLVPAHPPADITITRDVHYGDDPLQTIDIYRSGKKHGMPILIFVHGGGYVAADKNAGGPFFGNITSYFAEHGILAINANYRLAPKAKFPAGTEDVRGMVAWTKAHAKEYGGDPHRIFLMGHSAGATHVASYVLDKSLQPAAGPGVAGAILVSGEYRIAGEHVAPNVAAYFGTDSSRYAADSPLTHVNESKVPLFLITSEYDPVFLAQWTYELAEAVCHRDGKCPRFLWLKGHNHISEVDDIGSADQELGRAVISFVRGR